VTNDQIDEFVDRYLREMQTTTSEESSVWSTLDSLTDDEPETAWRVIRRLVAESPEMYLHQIGAGPLEALLSNRPECFGLAVSVANTDNKFREALRYVRGVEIPAEWHEAYDQLWRSEL